MCSSKRQAPILIGRSTAEFDTEQHWLSRATAEVSGAPQSARTRPGVHECGSTPGFMVAPLPAKQGPAASSRSAICPRTGSRVPRCIPTTLTSVPEKYPGPGERTATRAMSPLDPSRWQSLSLDLIATMRTVLITNSEVRIGTGLNGVSSLATATLMCQVAAGLGVPGGSRLCKRIV